MKSILLIVFLGFWLNSYSSHKDSLVLKKITYYYTSVRLAQSLPFCSPPDYKPRIRSQWDIINKQYKSDSIYSAQLLISIDSILRLSKSFQKRLNDSNTNYFNEKIEVNRVIIFSYNNKKIYLSDMGNWEFDFRFVSYDRLIGKKSSLDLSRKKQKNKFVWINGIKMKNDKKLKEVTKKLKLYLACDWCAT